FAVSAILTNLAMAIRNGILVILLDPTFQIFGYFLFPLALLVIVGIVRLLYERKKYHLDEPEEIDTRLVSPFEFGAAIRFAAVFGFILYISLVAQAIASDAGFLVISIIGGLINAGAVVTTAALTFSGGGIGLSTAVYSVVIATTMAIFNKTIFVYQADRETKLAMLVFRDGLIMAVGVVIYFILISSGFIPMT
ncbi:MAG: DUF4010 domain-containing protein, partial [Candidatus Thorarchaeota archaeon]